MSLRVIGSGIGRTGTHSLKLALEKLLGAPCYHMVEVFPRPHHFKLWTAAGRGEPVDWDALFDGFAATVDWPSGAFWEPLSRAYPDAIILHSERDSAEAWWKSASETIFAGRTPPFPVMKEMLDSVIGGHFTPNPHDREQAIAAYHRWNAHVRATAPKERTVFWKPGDGWAPICNALGIAVPAEPFPHVNTTDEFKARIASGPPPGMH